MEEIWERAVKAALDGQTDVYSVRSLNLDGAVKCLHGRLPQPSLFEKFNSLQHFSIANIGVSSLEQFPRLRNLQRLILSDNRIAGGLEFLVEAGLESLRDLDLSNNRISDINDLRPLAELRLVSLDLYECPVTRIKDYRAQVFGLIRSLKYLDKMDVDENERPESEDEEEDEEEEDDPGSGEVDGEDHPLRSNNGNQGGIEGLVDVDEDEESDADEEETETPRVVDGFSRGSGDSHLHSNGFGVVAVDGEEDDDDDEGEEDDDLVEVHEDDDGDDEDEDVVEVHEIDDSEDEDGVEYGEYEDDEAEAEEEEVNNDERDFKEAGGTGRLMSVEGEIDGHEQGEDDVDEDDNGETGEEEQAVEEDGDFDNEDEEEDYDNGYLVQPVQRAEPQTGGSYRDPGDQVEDPDIEEDLEVEEDLDGEIQELPQSSSQKRKRNEDSHEDDEDDCEDEEDDDVLPYSKSSKHY